MTSASDPKKPKPPKKGRPEERVSMSPEEAEKVLDGLLAEKPEHHAEGKEGAPKKGE